MKRNNIPESLRVRIWERDGWVCRYCGEPVIYGPTLKKLNELSPNHGYFHPNGKDGAMIKMFYKRWASVDHILPFTKGGSDDLENFATACWECNLKMNDKLDKPVPNKTNKDAEDTNWDGLYSLYKRL